MVRRREETRIVMDILGVSLKGIRLTHLMYRANLSYSTLRKYLCAMLGQGLIKKTESNGSSVYLTTEKGRELLNDLMKIKSASLFDQSLLDQ